MISFKCFNCGSELSYAHTPGRRDECPKCHADVHVCKNCTHFDPRVYNECREPQADNVKERDRANFCDYYTPGGAGPAADKKKDLFAAADALFKKK